MPLTDSIYSLADTLSINPTDSVKQIVDSINSIPAVINEIGHEGILGISLPANENWVFIVLTALFFLLIIAFRLTPGLITEEVQSILRVKERSSIFSSTTLNDSRFRILYVFFAMGVFSLYAYCSLYNPASPPFSFLTFIYFLLITSGFFLLKAGIIYLLGYIFFDFKTISIAQKSYFNFISLLGIILFPLLIVNIYASPEIHSIINYISLGACGIIFIFLILKLFQIFFSKLLDFLYILLYLCTLEILPVLILFQVFRLIV